MGSSLARVALPRHLRGKTLAAPQAVKTTQQVCSQVPAVPKHISSQTKRVLPPPPPPAEISRGSDAGDPAARDLSLLLPPDPAPILTAESRAPAEKALAGRSANDHGGGKSSSPAPKMGRVGERKVPVRKVPMQSKSVKASQS